jgi:2-polyprenyl-3-methyl-5-hydroxy-6-metoxy-1,4-benzoquinol methylase
MTKNQVILLESIPCPLGCVENDEIIFSAHDILHDLPGKYNVVRCRSCGLIRTNPRPTPESIGVYYPDNYGPYLGFVVNSNKSEEDFGIKLFLKLLVYRVFNSNSTILPPLHPGRMLEIGCASGSFLHQMAKKGWQVQGIEFSEKAAQAAKKLGYSVHAGALETAPQPEKLFDLIVGWMVLEHLHDPINCLRKLHEWSNPNAYLVLSIPNAGSLEFKLFKDKWYALQVPTHMTHFTPQSIETVLKACGWKLKKVYHQRTLSNFIASLGYVLRDQGYTKIANKLITFPEKGGVLVYILYPLSWLLSVFGQTGRMTVLAKKI